MIMKKDLNIMMGDKPLRLDPEAAVNVKQENPLTSNEPLRSGYFELLEPLNKNITCGTKSLRLAKN